MYRSFIKRLLDLVLALAFFPIFIISFFILGALIKKEDRGPVFFIQKRRGYRGRIFEMLKFRTMSINAPDLREADGSTLSSDHDPRVTKIGRILRKTSLDELPQILNVLKGDMSFIGPRPTLSNQPLSEYTPIRHKRLRVRPGITGYAQAYYRNSISAEEKFEKDAYYVDHASALLDLRIFLQTIKAVLMRKDINRDS